MEEMISPAVLDVLIPGWFNRINVVRLKMCSYTDCIVGQLYPVDREALPEVKIHNFLKYSEKLIEAGCDESDFSFNASKDLWVKEIMERKKNVQS